MEKIMFGLKILGYDTTIMSGNVAMSCLKNKVWFAAWQPSHLGVTPTTPLTFHWQIQPIYILSELCQKWYAKYEMWCIYGLQKCTMPAFSSGNWAACTHGTRNQEEFCQCQRNTSESTENIDDFTSETHHLTHKYSLKVESRQRFYTVCKCFNMGMCW